MADATISTYLELKDNLSAGLNNVVAEMQKLTEATQKSTAAMDALRDANKSHSDSQHESSESNKNANKEIGRTVFTANLAANAVMWLASAIKTQLVDAFTRAIDVSKEYENTVLKISSTLTAMNLAPSVEIAADQTAAVLKSIAQKAAKLPGEAKDYIDTFAIALPGAVSSGLTDMEKYADFVATYTATAISNSIDAKQAGFDLSRMLSGMAEQENQTYRKLQPFIGKTTEEFNKKLKPAERIAVLEQAIKKAGSGMAAAAETADAKLGELSSHMEEIYRIGGQPIFEGFKTGLTAINEFLDLNKGAILETVTGIAEGFADVMTGVLASLGALMKSVDNGLAMIAKKLSSLKLIDIDWKSPAWAEPFLSPIEFQRQYGHSINELRRQEKEKARRAELRTTAESRYPEVGEALRAVGATTGPDIESHLKKMYGTMIPSQKDFADIAEYYLRDKSRAAAIWQELIAEGRVKPVKMATAPDKTKKDHYDFRFSKFDIKQEFAEGFDPDRIAVAFASDLGRLGEMRTQSAYAQTYTSGT